MYATTRDKLHDIGRVTTTCLHYSYIARGTTNKYGKTKGFTESFNAGGTIQIYVAVYFDRAFKLGVSHRPGIPGVNQELGR